METNAVSLDDTLAAIDAAVGCQQCGRPLDGSVSDDFDSEECQAEWHAARASRLADRDPARVCLWAGPLAQLSELAIARDESIARAYEQFVARQRGMRIPND